MTGAVLMKALLTVLTVLTVLALPIPSQADDLALWYGQAAEKWTEALPLGNGRLGAMVFGGTQTGRIQLNEESLWAGRPAEGFAPDAPKHLAEVQRLVLAGKRREARDYGLKHLTQTPTSFRSYEPLGDLLLDFGKAGEISGYRRELSLPDAIHRTAYRAGKATITREVLVSAPADALAVRVRTDQPGDRVVDGGAPVGRRCRGFVATDRRLGEEVAELGIEHRLRRQRGAGVVQVDDAVGSTSRGDRTLLGDLVVGEGWTGFHPLSPAHRGGRSRRPR